MARLRLFTAVFALALGILVACGSDQEGVPRESESPDRDQVGSAFATPTTAVPSPRPTPSEDIGPGGSNEAAGQANNSMDRLSFIDLMELIPLPPDGGNWEYVYLNDYERMREAHGIQVPDKDATSADLKEYLGRVFEETGTTGGPWLSGYDPRAREVPEEREYLRIDIGNVDHSIWAEDLPRTLEAMTGRFDAEAAGRWLAACAECPEPEILEHGGIEFYSWGEDFEMDLTRRLQPPAFDPLGRGGRIAVLDSLVFRTIETEGMRYLIDVYLDNRESLADDPDLALAAGMLDALGVYSGLLLGHVELLEGPSLCDLVENCSDEELEKMRSQLGIAPVESRMLDEYILLGTGVGHDREGFYAALVFVYEDEDVAERNVGVFKEMLAAGYSLTGEPWSGVFARAEVRNDDRALIAKLRTRDRWIYLGMVFNRDSLLFYE